MFVGHEILKVVTYDTVLLGASLPSYVIIAFENYNEDATCF